MAIVVVVLKTGWELFREGVQVLLDASLDADTLLKIRGIILANPQVAEIRWLTGRNAGRFRFLEAEVALRVQDLTKAERVVQEIRKSIKEAVPFVDGVLIHAEPMQRTHLRYAVPLETSQGLVSEHFGEAPYFGLITLRLSDGTVERQVIVPNPYLAEEKAKGIRVAEWLVSQKIDVVLLKESLQRKGPLYVFRGAGITLADVPAENFFGLAAKLAQMVRQNASGPLEEKD
ncbi:MAG: hypothetical protein J7M05_10255 [Anaerolineae bacterium]|nr:hypothetical protein [Anaerolineae bacterium]